MKQRDPQLWLRLDGRRLRPRDPVSHTNGWSAVRGCILEVGRGLGDHRSVRCLEVLLLAAVAGVALTATPAPAAAHLQQTGVEATLQSPSSPAPGVSVAIDHSIVDRLTVTVRSGPVVEVDGIDGRPFLRIGPSGVDALTGSADWQVAERVHLVGGTPFAHVPAGAPAARVLGGVDARQRRRVMGMARSEAPTDRRCRASTGGCPLGDRRPPRQRRGADRRRGAASGDHRRVGHRHRPGVRRRRPGPGPRRGRRARPSLVATLSGTATVIIVGVDGSPLVRFGRDGSDINTGSVTWELTSTLAGVVPVPPLGPDLAPRWVHDGAIGIPVEWVEPRLDYPERHPRGSASHPVTVSHWSVPLLVNGAPATVTGTTDWQAYASTSAGLLSSPAVQAAGVVAAGAVIGAAFVVSRRRRSPTATRPSVTM